MSTKNFKISIHSLPYSSNKDYYNLLEWLVDSLDLANGTRNKKILLRLLDLFIQASRLKHGKIKEVQVINSCMDLKQIHELLKSESLSISFSQLFNSYLRNLIQARLVEEKASAKYALRADSLQASFKELRLETFKEFDKILEHAIALDNTKPIENNVVPESNEDNNIAANVSDSSNSSIDEINQSNTINNNSTDESDEENDNY